MLKNKLLLPVLLILLFFTMPVRAESFYGIGAELFKDPFNKKTIITSILPNSPAEKSGIIAGSEIISVDRKRIRKLNLCEIIAKIRGKDGEKVELVIRNGWNWKKYVLERELIVTNEPNIDSNYQTYWMQVKPVCLCCNKFLNKEITDKFSRKYRKKVLPVVNYWIRRENKFKAGYDTCMSYSNENKEMCMINLLNRENLTTLEDKKIYKLLRDDLN